MKHEKDCCELRTGKHRTLELYARMRNTETCAIMPRLILEMRGIARIAGTAGGVNRTHKRTLAGAKSRHIVSLLCRKNPVFSLKKPYITLHLL